MDDFRAVISATPDRVHTLAAVHPTSMHNLMLRYWLASGGIDPDKDVNLVMIPPPQMVTTLKAGSIDGYCVGEPWNSRAVQEDVGFVMATDLDLWAGHPEKVLGVREDWANQYPQTHLALVKALLEACEYCDDWRNREDLVELLARPEYVGAAPEYIRPRAAYALRSRHGFRAGATDALQPVLRGQVQLSRPCGRAVGDDPVGSVGDCAIPAQLGGSAGSDSPD